MNNDFKRNTKNNYSHNNNNTNNSFELMLNKIIEKKDLSQFKELIYQYKPSIKNGLLNFLLFYIIKDIRDSNINSIIPKYISILLSFGLDPNIVIDEINSKNYSKFTLNNNPYIPKGKSLLMFACEKSSFSLVKYLCEKNEKKQININYCDKSGRNCLFYLRGLDEDYNIIEYLVKKDIEINRRDNDENTVLNFLIINTDNIKLIYDFIFLASPTLTKKNKQSKTSLDLINEKWIEKKNHNNISNFEDVKKLIDLIKNKLSLINKVNNNKYTNNSNNISNKDIFNNDNNLIKLSTSTTMTTEGEQLNNNENNNNSNKNNNKNDIYIKYPHLSLVINTEFNDNDEVTSTTKKIDNYIQLNKNKKYFLNLLKNAEFKIKEDTKYIQEEIQKKKKKLNELKNQIEEKKINLNKPNEDLDKKIESIQNTITQTKKIIDQRKQNLIQENKTSLINVSKESKFYNKYLTILNPEINKELIYSQLRTDLIDFMNYVHKQNAKLELTIEKINSLIEQSVLESLGEEYHLQMYGSRATKLCLPWSDIDYVISYTINRHKDPLLILYEYLYTIPNRFFVDMKYISGASVPVLKIYTNNEFHKISLDISMENQEHHGEECVNYIKKKINEFEVLTPMTFALKNILQKAFLNDPYKGGLSSYGVILLIIHFLIVQKKMGNDISMNNLGKLFYDILYYYGNDYEIHNPIIIDENVDYQKILFFHQFQLFKEEIILVDPLNISNNVAKNTRQYKNIQLAFKIAYISFLESCECGCHFQYDGINIKEEGCGHNLLQRIFNDVKRE